MLKTHPTNRNDRLDTNNYKKVLELMLDLEKKMEGRVDELQAEIRKDMLKFLDDRDLKTDL